eukprot:Lithocolla_globosa_v1_NODE_1708_length_2389_cov_19.867609.p2 type:complete len:288 gc:universal NODE_1708_length_2389_cov_19.867609:2136-1273(-)
MEKACPHCGKCYLPQGYATHVNSCKPKTEPKLSEETPDWAKVLFNQLNTKFDTKFDEFNQKVKKDMKELQTNVKELKKEAEKQKTQTEELTKKVEQLQKNKEQPPTMVPTTDPWTKKPRTEPESPNKLVFKGLPKTLLDGMETQQTILATLTQLFKEGMHKQFPSHAVQDAFRLSKTQDVILTFKLDQLDRKVDLQQATKSLWQHSKDHLTTALLNPELDEENITPIYIYPLTTPEISHLHFTARQIPREKLQFKWICARTHKLFVKKDENAQPLEITTKQQLEQFQ